MMRPDWTSHGAYLGVNECPSWLHRAEMMELYGTIQAYGEYLLELEDGQMEPPDGFEAVALYDPRLTAPVSLYEPAKRGRSVDEEIDRALIELGHVTHLSRDELIEARAGRGGNPAQWLTVWWIRWHDRVKSNDIARFLGVSKPRVSQLQAQAKAARGKDERLTMWMNKLEDLYQR